MPTRMAPHLLLLLVAILCVLWSVIDDRVCTGIGSLLVTENGFWTMCASPTIVLTTRVARIFTPIRN